MDTNPNRRLASVLAAGGLALASVTATTTAAIAHEGGPHVEQVALADGTDEQLPFKSKLNGTAQVTSATGSHVVFSTDAALVPEDTNQVDDVYLRNRIDGTTTLISSKAGLAGNDSSFEPTISNNGRWVAYTTMATDLAKGTGGEALDVVVRDLESDRTVLVSRGADGKPGRRNSFFPVISGNGRHVSFQSFSRLGAKDEDRTEDVYLRSIRAERTRQVSLLPSTSRDVRGGVLNGDVSDDGRFVTFGDRKSVV